MPSYYEVNVSLNGMHFFATAPRSAQTHEEGRALLAIMQAKFPASEGYEVTGTHYECAGRSFG